VKPFRANLLVCAGTGCVSNRSFKVKLALEQEIIRCGLEDEVRVVATGCQGFCERGPIVIHKPDGIFYQRVSEEEIPMLVAEHLLKGRPYKNLMYTPGPAEAPVPKLMDIDFFKYQRLIVLRNRGIIDPEVIDDYIAHDGYLALHKALTEMTPESVIDEITMSGLRGRGGAGFLTGLKWGICSTAQDPEKFIVCNADEGDPGAFMDRSVLEADPHAVIEGMAIGAYAIGAQTGYVYVRDEYPLACQRITKAISHAEEYGLLGDRIFETDFSFKIKVVRGAGAFVCGEETALMASIEGRMGKPRQRPPFPAQKGLWGHPTNINNVETWANVPIIIMRGADWYASIGTEKSKGTKIFSLVGKVNNTGLVEVPMGISLRKLVFDIGGGIIGGKELKAVQSGGPSGGMIPKELMDLPVDYERLAEAGSIMGSGGLIVMDETNCMVDIAKYFLGFTTDESCGKCTPCRVGTKAMWNILDDITRGRGKKGDIELLKEIATNVKSLSLCGLGQTAPNPVLTMIRYFGNELEVHINERRCPTNTCTKIAPAPCQRACPIGMDVPTYVALIANRRFDEALEVIRWDNPLPAVCGRVCPHGCEFECKRGTVDTPIAICSLKRFVVDYERARGADIVPKREAQRKERVAIVGSGPAGLTVAHDLALWGYAVTVFEALPEAGGMLRSGIPGYRLPKDVLDIEIDAIRKLGVEIKTSSPVGKNGLSLDDLKKQFDAVFLAVGAHRGFKLEVPGEDKLEGCLDCITFLRGVNIEKNLKKPGERVAVIGGGNAAMDAARTAVRLGCSEVNVIYRRSRAEMPADQSEIEPAIEEGVKFHYLAQPIKVLGEREKVTGVECLKTELGAPDLSGRRRPVPVKGSEFIVDCDVVIPAISQVPELGFLPKGHGLKTTKLGTLDVDPETLETPVQGIFAGGDAVTGPATVIEAIAGGQRAAVAIHNYIRRGEDRRDFRIPKTYKKVPRVDLTDEEKSTLRRPDMPHIPVTESKSSFREVVLDFDIEAAVNEAKRCLRCDLE